MIQLIIVAEKAELLISGLSIFHMVCFFFLLRGSISRIPKALFMVFQIFAMTLGHQPCRNDDIPSSRTASDMEHDILSSWNMTSVSRRK